VSRASDQSGFSLVEVLVAALVLVLGATAAFSLIDSANRSISANSARAGGTNLARELTEYARATDYDLLQTGQVVPALRARASVAGTLTGSVWTIERRNVVYTIATTACTFDDPKDGLATAPPENACPAAAAVAGAPATDVNPDDFRKVTFAVAWTARGRAGKAVQSTAVVNPAGGLGPRITRFDEPGAQISADHETWGGTSTLRLTSTPASAVFWTTDDGKSGGDAGGGQTDWGFTWDFGTPFSASSPWVRDGTYTVQAQAKDSRGVPGESKIITVHLNRHPPGTVEGFVGGWNETHKVVDLRWDRYDERDLQAYVVKRNGNEVCRRVAGAQQELSCSTSDIGLLGGTYQLYALDCTDLKARTGCDRPSPTPATVVVLKAPSQVTPASSVPTNLTATVVDGLPKLTWSAPTSVTAGPIRFYRIYRDSGTQLSDRYDETITNATSYADPLPGATTAHTYWVTAVDQNFNESDPSAPVTAPPLP
jgi:prepilin-type N-terminal cleavage/methylation domain-containing protein